MTEAEARWAATLDDYERRLVAIRDATAAGDPTAVPPFVPPSGLGPMPAAVVPRAKDLLVRSHELERTIAQARAAVHARLAAPAPVSTPRVASRLDVSV